MLVGIVHQTVAMDGCCRGSHTERTHGTVGIGKWNVEDSLEIALAILAQCRLDAAFPDVDGFPGNDIDGPTDGIATVESALRPSQHLYAFHVGHIDKCAYVLRQQYVIHVETHSGVKGNQYLVGTYTP